MSPTRAPSHDVMSSYGSTLSVPPGGIVRLIEVRIACGSFGSMMIGTPSIVQVDCPAMRTGTVQVSVHGDFAARGVGDAGRTRSRSHDRVGPLHGERVVVAGSRRRHPHRGRAARAPRNRGSAPRARNRLGAGLQLDAHVVERRDAQESVAGRRSRRSGSGRSSENGTTSPRSRQRPRDAASRRPCSRDAAGPRWRVRVRGITARPLHLAGDDIEAAYSSSPRFSAVTTVSATSGASGDGASVTLTTMRPWALLKMRARRPCRRRSARRARLLP